MKCQKCCSRETESRTVIGSSSEGRKYKADETFFRGVMDVVYDWRVMDYIYIYTDESYVKYIPLKLLTSKLFPLWSQASWSRSPSSHGLSEAAASLTSSSQEPRLFPLCATYDCSGASQGPY